MNTTSLLTISAVLFVAAFFCPPFFFWGIFIYLIPIFYCAFNNQLNFKRGFYWGCVVYTLHLVALFVCIYEHGAGGMRMLAPLALVFYFALYAGLWFFVMNKLIVLHKTRWWQGVSVVLPTFLYIWLMYEGVFWIFEFWYGYCFTHPLLPLACYRQFLTLAPHIGPNILILFLITGQACVAYFFTTGNGKFIVAGSIIFLPFSSGWLIDTPQQLPSWQKRVGVVSMPYKKYNNPYACALAINNQIERYLKDHPDVQVVVMPESAFPFVLNQCPKSMRIWAENVLQNDIHLLIGASREQEGKMFNSLFHIYQGLIINFYDKQSPFFFAEYTTFKNKIWRWLGRRFWHIEIPCATGSCPPSIFECGEFRCVPQICSDLFLGHATAALSVATDDTPIVCIANDRWLSMRYTRGLMSLYARFIGLLYRCTIVYVSCNKRIICLSIENNSKISMFK